MESYNSCMKLMEIDSVTLKSQIISPFCIFWSEDDKVLIIAEGGVYVFELKPTPLSNQLSLTFIKSWIAASASTPLTNAVVDDRNELFVWSLERNEAYEAAIDSTLSYIFYKPTSTFSVPHIIQCKFSPLINNKSYISCLTNHGLLEIYKTKLYQWISVINVSNLWISYCNSKYNPTENSFYMFKSRMYELKITTIQWFKINNDVIFLTGHENGGVVIWNFNVSYDDVYMNIRHYFQIDEKPRCIELSLAYDINHILIFIGTMSGVIKCILTNLLTGEIIQDLNLWNEKDLLVSCFLQAAIIEEEIFLLTIKRHILLVQNLSLDDQNNYELKHTQWQEFSAEIISMNKYYDEFIICLQNYDIYSFTVKNEKSKEKSFNLKPVDLDLKPKHKMSHHCYGLTMSQNGAIWILVSSPKINYDSLKEISHLFIYSPETKKFKSYSDSSTSQLIKKITKESKNIKISEIYDLLELKKIELLFDKSKFRKFFEIKENLSLLDLQLMLWEVKLKLHCSLPENESVVNNLELLIAKEAAKKIISNLKNLEPLPELEKKSLILCQTFTMKEKNKSSCGICSVCGEDFFFESTRIFSCLNSHRFPQCCLSLLPCDVCPYAICRLCDSVALLNFVTEINCRCTYCGGLLEPDVRVHGKR